MSLSPTARPKYCPDQPVMWREPGTVQFDTDDTRTVVSDLAAADVRWLTALDGMRTWADVLATDPTVGQRRLLEAAIQAGAIDDCSQVAPSWRLLTTTQRDHLAASFIAARHTYRDIEQTRSAVERRLTLRVRLVGAGPLLNACEAMIDGAGIARADQAADLTIIAGGSHPDAAFQHPIMQEEHVAAAPHLVISAYGAEGTAGPLVIPGITSCLMCDQLHRRDADPAWPVLVSQRSALATPDRPWPIDGVHAQALIAHGLILVRAWYENPEDLDLWANQVRSIRLPAGKAQDLPRPIHPQCGCTWSPMSEAEDDG